MLADVSDRSIFHVYVEPGVLERSAGQYSAGFPSRDQQNNSHCGELTGLVDWMEPGILQVHSNTTNLQISHTEALWTGPVWRLTQYCPYNTIRDLAGKIYVFRILRLVSLLGIPPNGRLPARNEVYLSMPGFEPVPHTRSYDLYANALPHES